MSTLHAARGLFGRLLQGLGRLFAYGGGVGAALIVLLQSSHWLQQGQWLPIAGTDALQWCALQLAGVVPATELLVWIQAPASWVGMHALLLAVPASVLLVAVAFAGLLLGDWGSAERDLAERARIERRREAHAASARVAAADALAGPPNATERDIVRWLAMNAAETNVATADAMARHLGPAAAIVAALATLEHRGLVRREAGRAVLTERGIAYCIDEGWTLAADLRAPDGGRS